MSQCSRSFHFKFGFEIVQSVEALLFKFPNPALVDLVDWNRVEIVQLLPPPPLDRVESEACTSGERILGVFDATCLVLEEPQVAVHAKAFWSATAVGAVCAAAMLTLLTRAPSEGSSWELAYPPAWWQFEWLEAIGFFLCALPSYAAYRLDDFFASKEYMRNPFVGLFITIEVLLRWDARH
jgi:hypothetical protein